MKTTYERADIVPMLAELFREFGYEGTSLGRRPDDHPGLSDLGL